jgi:2,4-dienoyl-CoA reductase-like NADH-dependent reductase (Old Yellow Enzyme family)
LYGYTNERADRWGGDTRRRAELLLAVFKAVRGKVGGTVPIGARISQGKVIDFLHKWKGRERDAEIIFGSLGDAGADFIHVTEFEACSLHLKAAATASSRWVAAMRLTPGSSPMAACTT